MAQKYADAYAAANAVIFSMHELKTAQLNCGDKISIHEAEVLKAAEQVLLSIKERTFKRSVEEYLIQNSKK